MLIEFYNEESENTLNSKEYSFKKYNNMNLHQEYIKKCYRLLNINKTQQRLKDMNILMKGKHRKTENRNTNEKSSTLLEIRKVQIKYIGDTT